MPPGTRPGAPDAGGNQALAARMAAFPGVKTAALIVTIQSCNMLSANLLLIV